MKNNLKLYIIFYVLPFVLCLFLSGCVATQKDMVGLQSDIVTLQNQLSDMQKNQADLSVQIDELNSNIKMLDGKIDETNEKFLIFGQKLDDTNVDFTNKLSLLSDKVTKKIEDSKPTPTQIYGAAYTDYTMKNYDLAVSGFQEYIQQYPNGTLTANAYFWIGVCFYDKEDYDKAIENFDKIITDYPSFEKVPTSKLKKANALLKLKKEPQAIQIFEDIVKNNPKTPEARQSSNYLSGLKNPK
ncbi:MAG: tol-pal system protein YbgF [Elusimicrobia bacterium]|nr:tol-pal system protein YbgF [Elusimicrobiota bacterium]